MTAAELAARLAACRRDWLPKNFPAGKIEHGVFLLGNAEGALGRSLPVPLDPRKAKLADFGSGWRGDDLDLWAAGRGIDASEAYHEAAAWLGLWQTDAGTKWDRRAPTPSPPARLPLVDPAELGAVPDDEQDHPNRELAQEVWRETTTIPPGLAHRYLTGRRGITDWDDDRLRWHPTARYNGMGPGCVVAPVVSWRTGMTVAIWRIFPSLTEPMAKRRAGFGPIRGNAARLFWADGDRVAIAEGVEDALALRELTGWPAWSALNAGNMARLVLPARIRRALICQDADPPDRNGRRPGPEAAQALAQRLRAEGREVEIVQARGAKDANALLQQRTAP
jgi:hypothetical protein